MPSGVPVATVALNGAKNAALLAIQMLGIKNVALRNKFIEYKRGMANSVKKTASRLEKLGYKEYLKQKRK
jgi:5-(carboxyamino)imidazole ribonucleotide mutase